MHVAETPQVNSDAAVLLCRVVAKTRFTAPVSGHPRRVDNIAETRRKGHSEEHETNSVQVIPRKYHIWLSPVDIPPTP